MYYFPRPSAEHLSHEELLTSLASIIREQLCRTGSLRIHQFGSFRVSWRYNKKTRKYLRGRILFNASKTLKLKIEPNPAPLIAITEQTQSKPIYKTSFDEYRSKRKVIVTIPQRPLAPAPQAAIEPASSRDVDNQTENAYLDTITAQKHSQWPLSAVLSNAALGSALVFGVLVLAIPGNPPPGNPSQPQGKTEPLDPAQDHSAVQKETTAQSSFGIDQTSEGLAPDDEETPSVSLMHEPQGPSAQSQAAQTLLAQTTVATPLATLEQNATTAPDVNFIKQPAGLSSGPYVLTRPHKIKTGDTLWSLAGTYYGKMELWPYIYLANRDRINNPHRINPGVVLKIPVAGK